MSHDTKFQIPVVNFSRFQSLFAKLVKKAIKLGVTEPYFRAEEKVETREHPNSGAQIVVKYFEVTVYGEAPKYSGWALQAVLQSVETDEGKVNILRTVPGVENLPSEYRTTPTTTCDHCRTNRRRNDLYVLRHEDGTYKVVGSNCLSSFLGGATPENIAARCEYILNLGSLGEEDFGWGHGLRGEEKFGLVSFLEAASAVISKFGWLSVSKSKETDQRPTKALLMDYLTPSRDWAGTNDYRRFKSEIEECLPNDDDREVELAIEWARSISPNVDNDYLFNLRTVAALGYVENRTAGLATSLLPAYRREMGKIQERKAEGVTSEYVGEVTKRYKFVATIIGMKDFDSDFGSKTLYRFRTVEGNILTWWSSGNGPEVTHNIGDTLRFVATVKKFEIYNGVKQTVISRANKFEQVGSPEVG